MKDTWRSLNNKLRSLPEDQVYAMLQEERSGERRASVLMRLHQRYCTLRAARERIEIMQEATKP